MAAQLMLDQPPMQQQLGLKSNSSLFAFWDFNWSWVNLLEMQSKTMASNFSMKSLHYRLLEADYQILNTIGNQSAAK